MDFLPLSERDEVLVQETKQFIIEHYKDPQHHLAAGLLTSSGTYYFSLNLKSTLGRTNVCAEVQALGKALAEKDDKFLSMVAIRKPGIKDVDQTVRIVTPCGPCREILCDYGPHLSIIVDVAGIAKKCPINNLLPFRFNQTFFKNRS